MQRNSLWILTDGNKLLGSDFCTDKHFETLNMILERDSTMTARWKKVEDPTKRETYVLTDGEEIFDSRELTVQSAIDQNEIAFEETGGNLYWAKAGQEVPLAFA